MMATVVGGTHPTGMHSCKIYFCPQMIFLRRLCFYTCLSVILFMGACVAGGMHSRETCMVGGMCGSVWQECVVGMCGRGGMHGRGHAWQGSIHGKGCVWWGCAWQSGMYGRGHAWQGACMVGGMCGRGACVAGEHAWQGVCMAGGHVWWG